MKVYELRSTPANVMGSPSASGPASDGLGLKEASNWVPKYRDMHGIRIQAGDITLALDRVKDYINTQIEGANVIDVEDYGSSDNPESERRILITVKEGTRRRPGLWFRLVEIPANERN